MPATALPIPLRATSRRTPDERRPTTAARVVVQTLGACRIVVEHPDGAATLTPASDRLFTLLLLLAAEPGRSMPRARAAAWLWPDRSDSAARHALRQVVYRLRRLGAAIDGDAAHLALVTPCCDASNDGVPRAGRCLPGWDPQGDALRGWVDRYRARVEATTAAALARALADARAANRDGIALAAALLELDPRHPLARTTLPRPTVVREPEPEVALPCVGRDDVLQTLRACAASARGGRGTAIVLAAPAGAGVSRLLAELAGAARALGFIRIPDRHDATGAVSFATGLAAATATLLDRPGALGCSPDALRVTRRFTAAPALPVGDTAVRRLGTAIAELTRAVAAESPVLLTVDARCATPSERALTAAVARALDGAAALAVFTALPATPSTFGALRTCTRVVPVVLLPRDDAAALATAAAASRGSTLHPDDLAWCVAMGRGRPGDVIALALACAARPGTRTLPPLLATRLRDDVAALPVRTRQVAALCTLLGDTDTVDRAARVLGRHRSAIDAALFELRRGELPGDPFAVYARGPHRDAVRAVGLTALATLDGGARAVLLARAAGERRAAAVTR